jgi:hypothetical protein
MRKRETPYGQTIDTARALLKSGVAKRECNSRNDYGGADSTQKTG